MNSVFFKKGLLFFPFLAITLLSPLQAKEPSLKEILQERSLWNTFSLFDDFNRSSLITAAGNSSGMNLYEEDNQVVVEANLPGLKAEEIEVTYDRGSLWIKGKKEMEDKERNYFHRSSNAYAYVIDIPSSVDESLSPKAEYENGVMTIRFQKSEKAKPKRIEVTEKK